MSGSLRGTVWAALLLAARATATPLPCLLNEVCYDPPGADGGREFVELYAPGDTAVALRGWRLQFANGAEGERWSTRWTGGAGDSVAAGGLYLIADRGWSGEAVPQAVVDLDLQNGPDAVRLVAPDGAVDLLGYGELEQASLSEGAPHPGVHGGSLARYPDGRDTDHNDLDWRPADPPTPGAANWPRHGLRVLSFACDPPSLVAPGGEVAVVAVVLDRGIAAMPEAVVELLVDGRRVAARHRPLLAPGATDTLSWSWSCLREGRRSLSCRWPVPDDGGVEVALGGFHCGASPLWLSEIMPAPSPGGSEWIELVAADGVVELSDYRLRDADGGGGRLPSRTLLAGERVLLVADLEALAGWWWSLPRDRPCGNIVPDAVAVAPAGWPSLNNSPPAGRAYADRIELLGADGLVLDHVTYGRAGESWSAGRSLERSLTALAAGRDLWSPCTDGAGATPACGNSVDGGGAGGALRAVPPRCGSGGTSLQFDLGDGEQAWRLAVYDLRGRCRRRLGGDALGPGPRRRHWDGRDDAGEPLPAGPYLVVLRCYRGDAAVRRERLLVVVAP